MRENISDLIDAIGQEVTYYQVTEGSADSYEDIDLTYTAITTTVYIEGKEKEARNPDGSLDYFYITARVKGSLSVTPANNDKITFDSKDYYIRQVNSYYDGSNIAYYIIRLQTRGV